ncbi:hypothetical protein GDO81_003069 [Engystomops pustulosus]|nr:hypothetical protein GDO81_003069 [Engystomops pustulosus]
MDNYYDRAATLGKLDIVGHVLCSPQGELFCVRGEDLYRGPMPTKKDGDWFSTARRVGKSNWSHFEILFFHPNGELYATTKSKEFYKGPQPDNEYVPWEYGQATKIGSFGWDNFETLFFDPDGVLYAVTKTDKLVKGKPPTGPDYDWTQNNSLVGETGWLKLCHFISFAPDGKLWSVDKENGNIYRGSIPEDGRYFDSAEHLGHDYHLFRFLSFTPDKTIRNIISFEFLPEEGKRTSESAEVIEERIYDNRGSSVPLDHTFTFDKAVKISSSFSQDHGFTVEAGLEVKFTAGIPFFAETEATVKISASTTHTWSFTETNETEVKFSSSSNVEVPPGKAIRVVASVVKADLNVPYRARVKTIFGSETEVGGTWDGADVYNLKVTQDDYKF